MSKEHPKFPTVARMGGAEQTYSEVFNEKAWPQLRAISVRDLPKIETVPGIWYDHYPRRLLKHLETTALEEFEEIEAVILRAFESHYPDLCKSYIERRATVFREGRYRIAVIVFQETFCTGLRTQEHGDSQAPIGRWPPIPLDDLKQLYLRAKSCGEVLLSVEVLRDCLSYADKAASAGNVAEVREAMAYTLRYAFNLGSLSRLLGLSDLEAKIRKDRKDKRLASDKAAEDRQAKKKDREDKVRSAYLELRQKKPTPSKSAIYRRLTTRVWEFDREVRPRPLSVSTIRRYTRNLD